MKPSNCDCFAVVACVTVAVFAGCSAGGARSEFNPAGLSASHSLASAPASRPPSETIVYSFLSGSDGADPSGGLMLGNDGAFYGTTSSGGDPSCNCGTVYRLDPGTQKETVLYRFLGQLDAQDPLGRPIEDSSGALYGTTYNGGSSPGSYGTVYKLTPSSGGFTESLIHRFQGGADGAEPDGALIADKYGAFYGTTTQGGAHGDGTVFKLKPTPSGYAESVIYSFDGGEDGATPRTELLARSGSLYGTTLVGGGGPCALTSTPRGCGTVFELKRAGRKYSETVLYRFQGGKDGANPYAGLIADSHGVLYGTTGNGGNNGCRGGDNGVGCGILFKLAPSSHGYTESILHRFRQIQGRGPDGDLTFGPRGQLYGVTPFGGARGLGIAFVLRPAGSGYLFSLLYNFQGQTDGAYAESALIYGRSGKLFGITSNGGTTNNGTVFRFVP